MKTFTHLSREVSLPALPNLSARNGLENAYSQFVKMAMSSGQPLCPLHVGDTYLNPPLGCQMEDLRTEEISRLHNYAPIRGLSVLIDGISEKIARKEGLKTTADEIVVTAGATGGLFGLASALIRPGDEVLMLAPYWPLFGNAIRHYGGVTKSVSIYDFYDKPSEIERIIEEHVTPRTVAIYWNTPHNPTGYILNSVHLDNLVSAAKKHDLWIVSDEVYEHYVFDDDHIYTRPMAPERTISAYSFSKAFGMAGNRCGYLAGPSKVIDRVLATTRNSFYAVTTASQWSALRALDGRGDAWAENTKAAYAKTGREVAQRLNIPAPMGSTFLFVDVARFLGSKPTEVLLEACARRGVLLAPGLSFGPFPGHVRVCFTSAPPDVVMQGVDILAQELKRLS